jgi:hypothetical protein
MRKIGVWAAVLVLAAGALRCDGGCSCGQGQVKLQIPATPKERVAACADRFPGQTDLALFLVDMEQVRGTTSTLTEKFRGNLPLDAYRQEIQHVVGLDLLDKKSYEAAGVHPDAGLCFGTYRDAPVVMLYVTDRKKFETQALGSVRRYYRIEQAPTPDPQRPAILAAKGNGAELAYTYLDTGMVVLVGGSLQGGVSQPAAAHLAELLDAKPEAALSKQEGFSDFSAQFAESWPASVYMNAPRLLSLYKELSPDLKAYQKEIVDAAAAQFRWAGAGWKVEGDELRGRLFLGLPAETLTRLKGLDEPSSGAPDFEHMVGEEAYLFLRTSLDMKLFWDEYLKLIPERQKKFMQGLFSSLKENAKVDIEEDLIRNSTGNVGLAIYEVNPLMALAPRANERMRVVTAAAHLQLKDPARVTTLLESLVTQGVGLQKRELDGGLVAYSFDPNSSTAPPFTVYLQGNLLTLASNALGDEQAVALLHAKAPTRADKVVSPAAKRLFAPEKSTGLYLNVPKIRKKLGILGGQLIQDLLGPQEEIVALASLDPKGIAVDGTLAFTKPNQGAQGGKPAQGANPTQGGGAPPVNPSGAQDAGSPPDASAAQDAGGKLP